MSAEKQNMVETARPLDPNVLQGRASDPASSIWVSASAGTGKTKVLTDRVLRLLLPQDNGEPGTAPHKILGLTFTKAAASEMALRINETLSSWSIMELDGDKGLKATLKKLLRRDPTDLDIASARKLFADVIDTPGRLKIMTIHAFCQSLLARFPLESDLTPGFAVAEDRKAAELLSQARHEILQKATAEKETPLSSAMHNLAATINEDQLAQLLESIASERDQCAALLNQNFGIDGLYTNLCKSLGIQPGKTAQDILQQACQDGAFALADIKRCADALTAGTKTDAQKAALIHDFLASDIQTRIQNFNTYKSAFLTDKDEPRSKMATKAIIEKHPDITDIMATEAARILSILETLKSTNIANLTRDILTIGDQTLSTYTALKTKHNLLDYDDLIAKTGDLLKSNTQWVHYKLDEGIDHILIDEAQDTNPEQWRIIEALCSEFFADHSQSESNRTIFTVGDEKQSIYSFQRASPEEFARMQNHFAQKITAAKQNWNKVDLNISFRSTQSVLAAVDAVFANPEIRKGLGINEISHSAFRRGQAGRVECWPLFENDKTDEETSRTWDPPIIIEDHKSGASKLAESIATEIKTWLDTKKILPSHNRPIEPGDIMILVRTRNAFVSQLIRALKTQNIPVGGLDRIVLNDQLTVQDMLAAAEFALMPDDDLTLACLLKSPLIGMDEDTLLELAHDRPESLWQAVQQKANAQITDYLTALIIKARNTTPFSFFAEILQSPCPVDPVSGQRAMHTRLGIDALESLDELLNAALNFEQDHTPALQNFLHWQRGGAGDIKRQNDDQSNHVSIMTVHGSKGLQAPIVFLPDTTGMPGLNAAQSGNRLLWPTQTDFDLPLWAPRKDTENSAYSATKETVQERLNEEYRRLLYVAMTRAEDRLIVAGHKNKRDINDECWYALVQKGLESHKEHTTENERLILENPQIIDPDRTPKEQKHETKTIDLPKWLYEQAPEEPHPPAPLIPSRPAEIETAALSPLKAAENDRFRRGNLTHTLLQFLPDTPEDTRDQAATQYLETHAADLSDTVKTSIREETLEILNNPEFSELFGPNSRAEVPITGLLPDGRLISGQIDRLLITDKEILIVDYKTNRPPPSDPKDIPQIYRNQLQAYADTLEAIYPNRAIKAALLWTDGPNLMPIKLD